MKKIIIALGIGQLVQITLLWLAERLTYSSNVFGFCVIGGVIIIIAVIIGAEGSLLELAVMENEQAPEVKMEKTESKMEVLGRIFTSWATHRDIEDMDEADELPKEVQVTNSNVKRVDP